MMAFLYAGSADFQSLAVWKSRPLQIGVSSGFACRIVFTPQKVSLGGHIRSFSAGWASLHIN